MFVCEVYMKDGRCFFFESCFSIVFLRDNTRDCIVIDFGEGIHFFGVDEVEDIYSLYN